MDWYDEKQRIWQSTNHCRVAGGDRMTKYIKFVFKNKEPLRIADDNSSQSGQMITLRYIPGTTIRGYIVNQLVRENDFEKIKKDLFSNYVRYLNAYISMENQELIPSPKGFYEKKVMKENDKLVNIVVKQADLNGKKRAALGRYCYFDQNRIHYYNVETGSDLKIKINLEEGEKQNVFRNEYIEPGYLFTGYIAVDYKTEKNDSEEKEALIERIKSVLHDEIILGNARSSGFGKCEIINCEITDESPYQSFVADTDQVGECYLLLLSNTTLRNQQGELCGFNEDILAALGEKMHVKNLQIAYCATSITTVRGYNRTWGVKIPSTVAYEQGSVFHLKYEGTLTVETIRELSDAGIGIRRNEGFGRVLFLKDGYEKINLKQSEEYFANTVEKEPLPVMNSEDKKVICIAARSYYKAMLQQGLQKFVLKKKEELSDDIRTSASQLGMLDSVITAYQYNPEQAISSLRKHLSESMKREENNRIQKQHNSLQNVGKLIENEILNENKKIEDIAGFKGKNEGCIMGISTSELLPEDEEKQMKLKVILDLIRFNNKGEK